MAKRKYFSTEGLGSFTNTASARDKALINYTYYIYDETETVNLRLVGSKGDRVFIEGEAKDYKVNVVGKTLYLESTLGRQDIAITLSSATKAKSAKATLYFLDGAYALGGKTNKMKLGGKALTTEQQDLGDLLSENNIKAASIYFGAELPFYSTTTLTTELEDIKGGTRDELFIGDNSTFNAGDRIDGAGGRDKLTLELTAQTDEIVGGVVSNVEILDINAKGVVSIIPRSVKLDMEGFDNSLEQINILNARADVKLLDQQSIADVFIQDTDKDIELDYDSQVVNGEKDVLNVTIDEFGHGAQSKLTIDRGIETIETLNIDVRDDKNEASDIALKADGVKKLVVTRGRDAQDFTLNADVEAGADFDSTEFVGDMDLTSADIKTATFGAGGDTATITGQANDAASSYNLGEGNNTLTVGSANANLSLAGDVTALSGNDRVTVNGNTVATLTARSTINVGGSDNVTGNTVTITGNHQGDVIAGNGKDSVTVTGATVDGSTIAVGNGANTVTTGAHAGSITGGADRDIVTTAAASGSIAVGNGFNTVTTAALTGSIIGGDDQDAVTVASTAALSSIDVGNGNNTVTMAGDHAGTITGGTDTDTVSAASTATGSTITLSDGLNTVTLSGAHQGTITGGADRDVVTVGSVTAGVIRTFDGTDSVTVNGNMTNGTIDVGGGNDNTVTVTGNVTASAPTSILFGDGSGNQLTIGGNLVGDDVVFGNGAGNSFTIGAVSGVSVATGAEITLGTGGNTGTIAGAVTSGSTITFGTDAVGDTGSDSLTIGNLANASPLVQSTTGGANELVADTATVIRMGGGNDQVTLRTAGTSALSQNPPVTGQFVVESGGFIHGEGGTEDTFTVVTDQDDDTNVIGRTQSQKVEIELYKADVNSYQPGDVITISFGGVIAPVSYTVRPIDIVQGDGALTSQNIAIGVAAALNNNGPFGALFGYAVIDGTAITGGNQTTSVYITSDASLADVTITAAHGATNVPVTVMQISDTRVTGFENVELVINNDANGNATTVQANFSLINGATDILLDSKVQRDATVETFTAAPAESLPNGAYTQYSVNAAQTFDLDNLQGGEQITVRGSETTTVGNQQVARINIDDREGPVSHQIGDEIVVTIGNVRMVYEVVAADLAGGSTELVDADRIGAKVRDMINARTADHGFTAVLDTVAQVDEATDAGASNDNLGDYPSSYNTGAWVTLTRALDLPAATVSVVHTRTQVKTTADATAPLLITGDNASGTQNNWDIGAALNPANNELLPGDVITVTRAAAGGQPAGSASYTVTAADCLRLNADAIAADLASQLGGNAQATFGVIQFGGAATLLVTRTTEVAVAGSQTGISGAVQAMTATDDGATDVVIDANLVATAANRTMDLTVKGYGDFDVEVVGNNSTTGFTNLALTLDDAFDHTIDLNGDVYQMVGSPAVTVQGNFSNSVTVVDEAGRSTAGQNIVLSEVLARTVNTSDADANFTIDQYTGVRAATPANFAGEVITVTTGGGDDHLRTLAQSALTDNRATPSGQQSIINLGAGTNRLSLDWGTGAAALTSEQVQAVGNIAYSGGLNRLDIETAVVLNPAALTPVATSTILTMPGGANASVNELTFESVTGTGNFTIRGAAQNFDISSGNFTLTSIGTLTVQNAAGAAITGDVDVTATGATADATFNVGNLGLDVLTVTAGQDANIGYAGLGAAAPAARQAVTLGDLNVSAADDATFRIDANQSTDFTVTSDLEVRSTGSATGGDATITVDNNTLSSLSVGGSVIVTSASENATLNLGDGADGGDVGNLGSTIAVAGGVTVNARDLATMNVSGNANSALVDSAVTVSGNIGLTGLGATSLGDAAALVVNGNTRTNVSLADGGTIDLVACGADDDTRVTISGNLNNFIPDFGNPDQTAVTDRSYAINLGAVVANSGRDAIVSLTNNDDTTYYGDLAVTVDSVDLFAYGNASVTIDGNNAATITLGTVDLLSQVDGSLAITNNDGGIYTVTPPGGSTRREVDFADITIGNVTIEADVDNLTDTGVQGDASFTVTGNDIARVQVGTIDVEAGGDATFRIDKNDDTTVTTLGVTINAEATATPTLTFSISDNDRVDSGATTVPPLVSSVTINGDVTLTAPSTTTVIDIDGNTGLSDTSRSTVTVNGDFRSTSGNSITASIDGNEFATINLGGSDADAVVNLTSTGDDVVFTIGTNQESTITLSTVTLDAKFDAVLAVTDNISSQVLVQDGRTTLNADDDAQFVIEDNGFGEVRFGDIQINASDDVDGTGGIGGGTVGFDIRDNTGGTNVVGGIQTVSAPMVIETGEVDINAGGNVDARIRENTDAEVTVGGVDIDGAAVSFGVDVNLDSVVRSGNIDIDATAGASFFVTGNVATAASKDAFVELASVVTRDGAGAVTAINRGSIEINAATVGAYGGALGFEVSGNSDSEVFLGNVSIVAADTVIGGSDVRLGIFATDDERIDVGNIAINADNDVFAQISNSDFGSGANVRTGDIVISSGNEPLIDAANDGSDDNPNVSSDLYFRAIALEGNDLNDNTDTGDNGQQITLTANSRGTGEGFVYANINNAPDLTTLTVSGTNAEIYLTGNIGGDRAAGINVFTLDLSDLDGGFASAASAYDPLGIIALDNRMQADGSYVETWDANFSGDIVRVEIGSGGLIYNANYSTFDPVSTGAGAEHTPSVNFWGAPWSADEHGWFSLGAWGDFSPSPQRQVIQGFYQDRVDLGDGTSATWFNAIQFEQGSNSYRAQVSYSEYDPANTDGDTNNTNLTQNDPVYYKWNGSTYAVITKAALVSELGIVDISYTATGTTNPGGDWVLTGPTDGTAFVPVTDAQQVKWNTDNSDVNSGVSENPIDLLINNVAGDPAEDNWGQAAKEVFTFTGDSVGEVVIGGFSPGAWGSANPDNGRLTDRLDFSQFDWNNDGVANEADAGLVDLTYFSFTVEDGDGYFADVVIDFIGGANTTIPLADFGSIRLVGVGEFDDAVSLVQQSVIFA